MMARDTYAYNDRTPRPSARHTREVIKKNRINAEIININQLTNKHYVFLCNSLHHHLVVHHRKAWVVNQVNTTSSEWIPLSLCGINNN
jgi:hypothetical protein